MMLVVLSIEGSTIFGRVVPYWQEGDCAGKIKVRLRSLDYLGGGGDGGFVIGAREGSGVKEAKRGSASFLKKRSKKLF
ncbi:hypothetical protein [Acidiphilium acidophilum]|uniref:hypothetical protein n=1 Tax=Acidiphilium acidophilum TaxID=76588 RepID=UPI002E8E74D1|nr:hypothetical protein [Acidiphilium acidophilum]